MSNFFTKLTSAMGIATLVVASTGASLVSAASEFLPYAEVLADNSVISAQSSEAGYRLGNNITRAEIAKVVANLGGIEASTCSGSVFSDVGAGLGDLCGYVEALADAGVVSTSSATFRPSANITRAEMVKMILGALGETGSETDAGYMDLTGLGDLAMYVNRANEIGCISDSSYFRPNASSSRGEAFKVAVVCAGLEVDTTPTGTGTTTPTGTGTTTSTGVVTGALTVALDGQAMAQYVPKNASSVKVGSVKLTAGTTDVTVQSLVVTRSGLGNANDISPTNGIRASQNGVVVSSSADYYNATSQKGTVYFSPALVVKAGASQTVDILVNLTGAENSQHQFTLDSVNASNTTVTGAPVILGLLNTTSYVTTTTTANLTNAGTVTAGKIQQLFAKVDVSAGGRETKVTGFTLTRANGATLGQTYGSDLNKRFQNAKVYKNGVAVGTITMTNEKLSVSGLADVLSAGNTQTYELKADILVDATSTALGLKFDATTDVNAVETTTGYSTQVSAPTTVVDVLFGTVEFTFAKTSTGNVTIAPGTNNVKLFAGKLSSSTPVSVRQLTITPTVTGTGILSYVNDQLSVKLNGSEIATLTSLVGAQVKTVSFVVDAANPAVITIEGSTKNQASIAPSSVQFLVALTEVRDSSNNTIASLGAGSNLTGDKTTINTSAVELKTATVAANSTTRIYSSAEQEIGRFAITSRNESSRLQTLTLPVAVAGINTTTVQLIANSTSSAKLVNVATNAEVSATVNIIGNTITFSSMNETIAKDVTNNYKVVLGVTSVESNYGMTVSLGTVPFTALSVVRDSNSSAITPTGSATTNVYILGTVAPTVLVTAMNENSFKVRVTNTDTNTGITLTGVTFDFKTALPGNTTYTASAYLRNLGTTNTFGGLGVSTGSGSVPGLDKVIAVTGLTTNMTADKNGGYIEFEVYIDSANLLPTGGQLQVSVKKLHYSVGAAADTESYVGTTGASATFTK